MPKHNNPVEGKSEWPVKAGSTRYRSERLTMLQQQCCSSIEDAIERIFWLDQVIERYQFALEMIQPSAQGKVTIRFLRRRDGRVVGRHPTYVQWFKTAKGEYRYRYLDIDTIGQKVKSYSLFRAVRQDVKELLNESRKLIRMREKQLALLFNLRRQVNSQESMITRYVGEKSNEIEEWLKELLKKRESLIEEWNDAIQAADEMLPEDLIADPKKAPRVAAGTGARGFKHPTHKTGKS